MQRYALLVCASLTVCCLGFLFRSEAQDADSYIIGQKLVYIFVTHGMYLMLLFILEYCKFSIPRFIRWMFHGINLLLSFAVLTLDHHPFFYKSYWAVPMDGYCILEKEYGFLHTLTVGLFGLYMAAAVVITVIFSVKNIRKRRNYVWRIMVAVMLPCVSYIIPKLTDSENDFQPIAFAAFSLLVLVMIYKNNLYDIDNIAARFSIASMDDAIIVFDDKYLFKGCSRKAEELFPELKAMSFDSDVRSESRELAELLDGKVYEYEADDRVYHVTVSPVGEGPLIQGHVVRLNDITIQHRYTELLQAHKERLEAEVVMLAEYSYNDNLTHLKNRRSFEEHITALKEKSSISDVAIGTFDINGLKAANDNICHAAGDEMIKGAADTIKAVFSPYGEVFRTGGDEFCVILSPAPKELDALTAEFEAAVAAWRGEQIRSLSISYGFAFGREAENTGVEALLIASDKAMYAYKKNYYEREGIDRRHR